MLHKGRSSDLRRKLMPRPLLFCHVGWMEYYEGKTLDDEPTGGGKYNETAVGLEVCNFVRFNGKAFGFVKATSQARRTPQGAPRLAPITAIGLGTQAEMDALEHVRSPIRGARAVHGDVARCATSNIRSEKSKQVLGQPAYRGAGLGAAGKPSFFEYPAHQALTVAVR